MTAPPQDVLRLITRLNIGGPARQALLLSSQLQPRWRTLLAAGAPAPDEGELSDPQVPVHRLPLVRSVRPDLDLRALHQVGELMKKAQPRLLHTHMAKAGLVGRLAARRHGGIRTIHTFHGHVLEGYFSKPVQRTFLEVERALAKITDALVAISPEIRDELLELRVGRAEQFRVIPLGFDLTAHLEVEARSGLLRSHLGLPPDVVLIGAVARLVPIKDLGTFLRALTHLPQVHGAILGDGEERPALELLAKELGIAHRTHFTGWWKDVPSAMSDLDVVVLTSLNEGTPVSLIEALACGRPVVATDVGGVRFVIEDGRTGRLIRPRDPEALARAVGELLTDPSMIAGFATAGRSVVRNRFHKDRLIADIDALYSELARAVPRRRSSAP